MNRNELEEAYIYQVELERRLCRNYAYFVKAAWSEALEPETPLEWNWHLDILCAELEKQAWRIHRREPKEYDLIINVPPRTLKSTIALKLFAAYVWTFSPWQKFLCASYSNDLVLEHSVACRGVIQSEWYQERWGHIYTLQGDQNVKSFYKNSEGGFRISLAVGTGTGRGGNWNIVDDAHDAEKAESDRERASTLSWNRGSWSTRLNNRSVDMRIYIMQRLHEKDVVGDILERNPDRYKHYCLPAILSDDVRPVELRSHYKDKLLFPKRLSHEELQVFKDDMGSYRFAGQFQQRPAPEEGGTFKTVWWRYWIPRGSNLKPPIIKDGEGNLITAKIAYLPQSFDRIIDSWDTALEGDIESDDVSGSKWGAAGFSKFLLWEDTGKKDYVATKKAIKSLYNQDERTSLCVIEKSSNGPAVKSDLGNEMPIKMYVTGPLSKVNRVRYSDTVPYAAQAEAGNIYIPHPSLPGFKWVNDWIREHAVFPMGAQDGRVDSAQMAVNELTSEKVLFSKFLISSVKSFKIAWGKSVDRPTIHYCSLYLDKKTMEIFAITALWDDLSSKLFCYNAYKTSAVNTVEIARWIGRTMHPDKYKIDMVLANDEIFADREGRIGKGARGVSKAINDEFGRSRIPAKVRRARRFDLTGSIYEANRMFDRDSIYAHTAVHDAAKQWAAWALKDGKPQTENAGYCYALCLLISDLKKREKIIPPIKKRPDYKRSSVINQSYV